MEVNGNTVKLTLKDARTVCRLGKQAECCIYLSVSDGFECEKNTSLGPLLKRRLAEGSTSAKGQGGWTGCPWEIKTT